MFTFESIEPSKSLILKKFDFEILLKEIPELKEAFLELVLHRLENYSKISLSRINDNPRKYYNE
jgi:hypothetical protein